MRYKVVGPPGTGKTRKLLDTVKYYTDQKKVPLDQIGYFAFTRKAAGEARDRYLKSRPDLVKKDIKYFQTIHSFAFNKLGLREAQVMQEENYKIIGDTCGIQIKYASYEINEFNGIFTSDSEYLSLINLARVRRTSPLDQLDRNEHLGQIKRDKLDAIAKEIDNYKKVYELVDFTDMLDKFLKPKEKCPCFQVVFIDEAQDLSIIQWKIIDKIEKETGCDVWVAGDDDQAIFGWAGADVNSFINWKAKEIHLKQSERVPQEIQERALNVIERVQGSRIPKDYLPKDELGSLNVAFKLADLPVEKGEWLILARTKDLLKPLVKTLKHKGVYFETAQGKSMGEGLYKNVCNWNLLKQGTDIPDIHMQRLFEKMDLEYNEKEDCKSKIDLSKEWYEVFTAESAERIAYLRSMIINNEDLSKEPRIKVSTIHGAKGGEATNVALLLNQTSNTMKGASKSQARQDEEYRVWYVGVTRTAQNLYIIKCKNRKKEFKI
jgi:superfamily I DNA/RNA helicase